MNDNENVTKSINRIIYNCDVCKNKFRYKSLLTQHMLVHTGEKDFECHVCLKKFARKNHLKEHISTHTKEKNFSCEICKKSFTR